jgi:hypothetical protein
MTTVSLLDMRLNGDNAFKNELRRETIPVAKGCIHQQEEQASRHAASGTQIHPSSQVSPPLLIDLERWNMRPRSTGRTSVRI